MLHTYLAALALTATTLAVSGCGGSSKTEPAKTASTTTVGSTVHTSTSTEVAKTKPTKTLTRTEFIVQGDAICARTNTQLASTTVKSQQEFEHALPQAAAYERTEAIELSKLTPPTSMANDWTQFVANLQRYATDTIKLGKFAQSGNPVAAKLVVREAAETRERLSATAKRNGFKDCSQH